MKTHALTPSDILELRTQALYLLRSGLTEQALALFEHLVNASPQTPQLWSDLSSTYLALNRTEEGAACALRAFELNPGDDAITAVCAEAMVKNKMYREARVLFEELLRRAPQEKTLEEKIAWLDQTFLNTAEGTPPSTSLPPSPEAETAPSLPRKITDNSLLSQNATHEASSERLNLNRFAPLIQAQIRQIEGKFAFFDKLFFPLSAEPKELERFVAQLRALPPFYLHFGGIGDGLLLRSTIGDTEGPITILCVSLNPLAAKSYYEEIPEVTEVFLLPLPDNRQPMDLIRFIFHQIQNCRGTGITSRDLEQRDWQKGVDIFRTFGVKRHPSWAKKVAPQRIASPQIVLAPRGSGVGMEQNRKNFINPEIWSSMLELLHSADIEPVIIGTPGEGGVFRATERCIDKRSYSFHEQMALIAGADLLIGADSWAKTFAALLDIPALVFPPLLNGKHQASADRSAYIFLEPWRSITQVTSFEEVKEALEEKPFWKERLPAPRFSAKTSRSAVDNSPTAVFRQNPSPPFGNSSERPLRVLMQLRPDAFLVPGGDLRLVQHVSHHLRKNGVDVTINSGSRLDIREFDLVQLCNFARAEQTQEQAQLCFRAGIPYSVFTLYEDRPHYYNPMVWLGHCLTEYVRCGKDKKVIAQGYELLARISQAPIQDNTWSAHHAEVLIASGTEEADVLRRDYPNTKRIEICHFGSEITQAPVSPDLFVQNFGVRDFILCVGRIEARKNQLMLLYALQESTIPIVLLGGAGSYEVEYADAVRQFQRKGKTVIVDEVSPEMLASAYAASRVHALPSWYELPGLVSLEASLYGTNVVTSRNGTQYDYFGELATYCEPGDPDDIKRAVLHAYESPKDPKLQERVSRFTWENTARRIAEIYRSIVTARPLREPSFIEELGA